MGIKDILDTQDAGFVGLRSLLEQMAKEEGVTLQQAATVLFRLLHDAGDSGRPQWFQHTSAFGVQRVPDSNREPWLRLRYVVDNGKFEPDLNDDIPF